MWSNCSQNVLIVLYILCTSIYTKHTQLDTSTEQLSSFVLNKNIVTQF